MAMIISRIHRTAICLAAFALLFTALCCNRADSLPEAAEAVLYLNVATIDNTKSGLSAMADNEKMHSVRVVVLHADGTVEHNRYFSLNDAQEQKMILLKVTANEKKKIFLFANEESVSVVEGVTVSGPDRTLAAFFNSYAEGASGFETAVNGLYFAPDYSGGKPIPMSSLYEIVFPEKGNFEGEFYVVRVATKFTVNFMNWRSEEVTVENFSIADHADKNFLMAHVEDSEQNKTLFNGNSWIEWLKEVSDASSENDTYEDTEAAGWLKDYELPSQADGTKNYIHGTVKVGKPSVDINNPDNSTPGQADNMPVFYLPESKSAKAGATDGEQEYALTINVVGRDEPFVCKLPNLKALFRNTHVVVNITMYNRMGMDIVVDVIPYSEVKLDPIFGL